MLVRTGKSITIEVGRFILERKCDSPGCVTVTSSSGEKISLPGNTEDSEKFIKAYLRALDEDIPYKEIKSESSDRFITLSKK